MATITVRREDEGIVEEKVISRSATLIPSNQDPFEPAVVQRIEYDHEGQMSQITTECGETENRREADNKPNMTVEGIITESQLGAIKSLKRGDEITLISDLHQGEVIVRRTTIEQNTDIIEYTEGGETELAFGFQLQLKQPE
jgi:hypothetical protein